MLEQRLYEGGGATCAAVAQRLVQGHDGLCDVFRGVRWVALGSCGSFLSPGGLGGLVATAPLGAPAFRAGQLPTEVRNFVVGTIGGQGLVTAVCGALRQGRSLSQLRWAFALEWLCSRSWHTGWDVGGGFQALMLARRCTGNAWRRAHRGPQEWESVSHQGDGSGSTP